MNKFLKLFLIICIYISIFCNHSYAGFNDVDGHWCEEEINNFLDGKFVEGYEDGSFRPDNDITRAELCKIINSYMGYIVSGDWQSTNMNIAYEMGYLQSGLANETITREEACVVICRAMKLENIEYELKYIDRENIANWAIPSVKTLSFLKYLKGYESNEMKPKQNITRAEVVSILYNYVGTGGVDLDISETLLKAGYLTYNEFGIAFVEINGELELECGDIVTLAATVPNSEDIEFRIIYGEEYVDFNKETNSVEAIGNGEVDIILSAPNLNQEEEFIIKISERKI